MVKLAYFCSEYPSRSHTFIRREIQELRRRGASIDVYALCRPNQENLISEIDLQEFQQTISVLPVKFLPLIIIHLKMFIRQPLKYLQTLKLAIGHRLPGTKNALWSLFQFAEGIILAQHLQNKACSAYAYPFCQCRCNCWDDRLQLLAA